MDRFFLDANVLFSIAYGSRSLGFLWEMARENCLTLVASAYVIEEARRNLSHPEQLSRLKELLASIEITPEVNPDFPCPVPLPEKDRPVLLAAVRAGATHLITGDLEHFGDYRGKVVQGVLICTPRDYFDKNSKK